jgi:LmbE family N-acetylglucosaminyl deacetylase
MRVLVVAAHPDDETLGVGGTIARYAERGDEVWVCILTEGVSARHNHVSQQKECALKACEVLGVKRVDFCDLPDQRLDTLPLLDVIRPVEAYVQELRPDVVYTHFKEDVNQDHRVAFQATMVATRPVGDSSVSRLLCFEAASSTEWAPPLTGSVFAANVFVDISETLTTKLEAMRMYSMTHMSEVPPYPHPRSFEALEIYAKRHGIAVGLRAAEPFMLVREIDRNGSLIGSNGSAREQPWN